MKKIFLVISLIIVTFSSVYPQVKIKERVEIIPGKDSIKTNFPGQAYDYTWLDVTITGAQQKDYYYYLEGYEAYYVALQLIHEYYDPSTGELVRTVSGLPPELHYEVYFQGSNGTGNSLIISGSDTCSDFAGIQYGFKILAGNEFESDSLYLYLKITTWNGIYRYDGNARIIIKKTPLIFQLEPSIIAAGDTVDIIIKKKLADNTTISFPPGQLFEVGIIDGCSYGKILREDGKDSTYFKDIRQPIKFIAADSINTDTAQVKLRIGVKSLYCYGGQGLLKSAAKTPQSVQSNYCSAVNFEYYDYETAEAAIITNRNNCKDWACLDNDYIEPKFEIKSLPNGTDGYTKELSSYTGYFYPLFTTNLFDFTISPCFNITTGSWDFKLDNNLISLRAINAVNKQNDGSFIDINNFEDLKDPSEGGKISKAEIQYALKDFDKQKYYNSDGIAYWPSGPISNKYYIIPQWLQVHEDGHQKDFEDAIARVLSSSKIRYRIKNMWKPSCDDFYNYFNKSFENLKQQGIDQFIGILKGKDNNDRKSFRKILYDEWQDFMEKGYYEYELWNGKRVWTDSYEQYTQFKAWEIINNYTTALQKRNNG